MEEKAKTIVQYESEPVSEAEEERDTGTEDRELGEDGVSDNGTHIQTPDAGPSAEGQHDTGDYDTEVRESNDSNGDSGTGISVGDNVGVDESALAKSKDFVITKTLAEDLTSAPKLIKVLKRYAIEKVKPQNTAGRTC